MYLALFLQQNPPIDQAQIQRMVLAFMAIMPIFVVICLAVVIVPFWFICKKAGFSPWLSMLNVVPLGGLILWYVLAFSDWKVAPIAQPGFPPPTPYPPQPPYPPPQA
jgi:hypothetical protein